MHTEGEGSKISELMRTYFMDDSFIVKKQLQITLEHSVSVKSFENSVTLVVSHKESFILLDCNTKTSLSPTKVELK